MGTTTSHFTQDELQEYSDLTYFTKKEIVYTLVLNKKHLHCLALGIKTISLIRVFKKFSELDPDLVSSDKYCRIPKEKICQMPEMKVNPFNDRICRVFSTSRNFDGSLSFEDFLDMMSAFSDQAPKSLKVEYAFKIYDFNEDDLLDAEDIEMVINRLTGSAEPLSEKEMDQLLKNIMNEADLDDDKQLSYAEFEHIISKSPDFLNSFRIRI